VEEGRFLGRLLFSEGMMFETCGFIGWIRSMLDDVELADRARMGAYEAKEKIKFVERP